MCHHCSGSINGFSRREMLMTVAGTSLAGSFMLKTAQAAAAAQSTSRPASGKAMPEIRAAFVRPKEEYWLGWPGTAWDKKACKPFMDKCVALADQFAKELKLNVQWAPEPLHDKAALEGFLARAKADQPEGMLLIPLHFLFWHQVRELPAFGVPTIIFAPLGTGFTTHMLPIVRQPGVYLASCADFDLKPVRFGFQMIRTNFDIRRTKIAVLAGNAEGEKVMEPFGLPVKHIHRNRFVEAFNATEVTPDVKAMVDDYKKHAAGIVEPTEQDLLNAARNYFAAKAILEQEGCQGITMDCLGLVKERLMPTPPCLAWSRFLDDGVSATCEADLHAVMSQELCLKLLGRPGFPQDPVPNTVDNSLIGAHCVCATRLNGFDKPREKFILRSHAESDIGVSVQVLWPEGATLTVMEMVEPGKMILGRGKVLRNHETAPASLSGGCRTSVEIKTETPEDAADTKGFHQLFILGDHVRQLRAYAQMYGIAVEHI